MSLRHTIVFAVALLASGTAQAQPAWHVALNLDTKACYRATALPSGDNWRDLGAFNTFREAGIWEWGHRNLCHQGAIFD